MLFLLFLNQRTMWIKRQIPNLFTFLNLYSGCVGLYFAFQEEFLLAFLFVALGIFFDFFDGFFARLFNVASPLGIQLDSLADMVTSGVVPGLVMFKMLEDCIGSTSLPTWIPFLGFIITIGSCYRLAKFNIDTRQTDQFIGLPTPANALFILSLPLVLEKTTSFLVLGLLINPYVLLLITAMSAFLLNMELPLFSLKIKKGGLSKMKLPLAFLALSLGLLIGLSLQAVPIIIALYIVLSAIVHYATKEK